MSDPCARGLLVILSAPSGGGKTTIIRRLLAGGGPRYRYSVSMTTRPMRPGDVEGKDYFFATDDQFRRAIAAGDLLEYEEVHGYLYGTPKTTLQRWIEAGDIVLLDLDVFGAESLKTIFSASCLTIFLQPPNMETLVARLQKRKTESPDQIAKRLQRIPSEMAQADRFDHVVINDDLDRTVAEIKSLIEQALTKQ